MNASRAHHKSSRIEDGMNKEIIRVLIIQGLLCFIAALIYGLIEVDVQDGQWYRVHVSSVGSDAAEAFVTWVLLLAVMLPISLYVTLELVKVRPRTLLLCLLFDTHSPHTSSHSNLHSSFLSNSSLIS